MNVIKQVYQSSVSAPVNEEIRPYVKNPNLPFKLTPVKDLDVINASGKLETCLDNKKQFSNFIHLQIRYSYFKTCIVFRETHLVHFFNN